MKKHYTYLTIISLILAVAISFLPLASFAANTSIGYWEEEAVRTATVVVAAADSSEKSKSQADYVCDGVDDQVEIQQAIDSLPSGGGKVVLLEGTFIVSNSILVKDYVSLEGQGMGKTIIYLKNNSSLSSINGWKSIINYDTSSNYVTLKNFEIDGNRANQTGECSLITLHGSYCQIESIYAHHAKSSGSSGYGIAFTEDNNNYNIIKKCRIEDTDRDRIVFRDTNNNYNIVSDCIMRQTEDVTYDGQSGGVGLEGGEHNLFYGNFISASGQSTGTSFGFSFTGKYNSFFYNTIIDLNAEPFYDHTGWTTAVGNYVEKITGNPASVEYAEFLDYSIVKNNIFVGPMDSGAILVNGDNIIVSGNLIYAPGYDDGVNRIPTGISLRGKYIICANNYIEKAYYSAIRISAPSEYCVIVGNTLNQDVKDGINGENNLSNSLIAYNVINTSATPIMNLGSGNIVKNNFGYTTENSGTATITAGDTSVTVNHGLDVTPTTVIVSPKSNAGSFWVDNITSTQFTINMSATRDDDVIFMWNAR